MPKEAVKARTTHEATRTARRGWRAASKARPQTAMLKRAPPT
jgi:hypothetical protein